MEEKNIRNSQGQDVQEPGKYSENVYVKDCPFLLGRQQVEWFSYFQRERDDHTITTVDDFMKSAKKPQKPLKESFVDIRSKKKNNL